MPPRKNKPLTGLAKAFHVSGFTCDAAQKQETFDKFGEGTPCEGGLLATPPRNKKSLTSLAKALRGKIH